MKILSFNRFVLVLFLLWFATFICVAFLSLPQNRTSVLMDTALVFAITASLWSVLTVGRAFFD